MLRIIVPTFNSSNDLITSVAAISKYAGSGNHSVKIHIFDDASRSIEAIDEAGKRFNNVQVHKNLLNLGEGGNVNRAMSFLGRESDGWCLLLHQDDAITPEWFAECIAIEKRFHYDSKESTIFYPRIVDCLDLQTAIAEHSVCVGVGRADWDYREIGPGMAGIDEISREWTWVPSGTLIRPSHFLAIGGFHPLVKYGGDVDFLVRWLLSGRRLLQGDRIGVFKRSHSHNTMSRAQIDGSDIEGYSYILCRYSHLRSWRENIKVHASGLRSSLSMCFRHFAAGDRAKTKARLGYAVGMIGSLVATNTGLQFLLPKATRRYLEHEFKPIALEDGISMDAQEVSTIRSSLGDQTS